MQPDLTIEVLHQLMAYDPTTGILTWQERPRGYFTQDRLWKRWNTRYAGKEAFSANHQGYLDGMIFRKMHKAHRVAWALHHGEWPSNFIDHINGNRLDNRIINLRNVTQAENARNAKRAASVSGVLGVAPHGSRWKAYIRTGGRNLHLGVFDTLDGAAAARKAANERYGYHPNHGRAS